MFSGNCAGATLWRFGLLRLSAAGIFIFPFAIVLFSLDGGTFFRSWNKFPEKIFSFRRSCPVVSSLGEHCVDGLCDRRNSIALLCGIDFSVDGARRGIGLEFLAKCCFSRAGLAALCDRLSVFAGNVRRKSVHK